jgi:hypothetical protein
MRVNRVKAGKENGMAKKLRPSGGYRGTASFQTTTIIYDATYWFCDKFLDPRSRMADQMVQAARSGRQNIAEGSRASATSSQTELRLLNVARSSLEELLAATVNNLPQPGWPNGRKKEILLQISRTVQIRLIEFPSVPDAARLWSCARSRAAKMPASNSGAALHIHIAKDR